MSALCATVQQRLDALQESLVARYREGRVDAAAIGQMPSPEQD